MSWLVQLLLEIFAQGIAWAIFYVLMDLGWSVAQYIAKRKLLTDYGRFKWCGIVACVLCVVDRIIAFYY